MSDWISIDKKLPDEEKEYLVYTGIGDMFNAPFDVTEEKFGWRREIYDEHALDFIDSEFVPYCDITHWMERPEPPRG